MNKKWGGDEIPLIFQKGIKRETKRKIRSVFILRKKKVAKRGTKMRKDMFSYFLLSVL